MIWQKIYDFTTHDVEPWIKKYLGNFKAISFTKCFRLGDSLASRLADAWNKPITGVNKTQKIKFMSAGEVAVYLSTKEPEDILALSPKKGTGVDVLNDLEHLAPDIQLMRQSKTQTLMQTPIPKLQFLQLMIQVKEWNAQSVLFLTMCLIILIFA